MFDEELGESKAVEVVIHQNELSVLCYFVGDDEHSFIAVGDGQPGDEIHGHCVVGSVRDWE